MLKPIETVYNGYRFRSRLEARWAVFFDSLGIKYEYELEGFDLGGAGWYLPDFYLIEDRVYIEIKPGLSLISDSEKAKIDAMSNLLDRLWSNPPQEEMDTYPRYLVLLTGSPDSPLDRSEGGQSTRKLLDAIGRSRLNVDLAIRAARQARFEHSEIPVGVR